MSRKARLAKTLITVFSQIHAAMFPIGLLALAVAGISLIQNETETATKAMFILTATIFVELTIERTLHYSNNEDLDE